MPQPILTVSGLKVHFGSRTVIQNLSFELDVGECLAVIGPNGSGKTVLLKALLGLLPSEGTIRWDGAAKLGYVPQKIAADLRLPLRLEDLLGAKAALMKLTRKDVEAAASEAGLTPDLLGEGIGNVSGGQLQKALIAFALLGNPNVMLFDEPTASLDELSEERIYELLRSLQQKRNMTVVLVSHDLSVVYQYADRVLCLSKGTACLGPPRQILTPTMLQELYAAPPKYYRHGESG